MKIFLSSIEGATLTYEESVKFGVTSGLTAEFLTNLGIRMKWNLMSYFALRSKPNVGEYIRDNTDEILIDSGAFSLQHGGANVDWENYTHKYARFIKQFDRPNVIGYFEMDVDNIIGCDKAFELRKVLLAESGHPTKIIPVWHRSRGVEKYVEMCEERGGSDIVAVTGFKNEDITDEQYMMFLKTAHENGKKLHCLGMTRRRILDVVPFDYVDSSSWMQRSIHGRIMGKKVTVDFSSAHRGETTAVNYVAAMDLQRHYYRLWANGLNE